MNLALELNSFSFAYPGQALLLDTLSCSVNEGSFVLLTGKTGCGKTTLLKNCKPELAPKGEKQGLINVFDKPLDSLSLKESAQLIGYVSQNADNQLISTEAWHELAFGLENIGTPNNLIRRRVAELAHFFGINSWLHQKTATLSGGQKQLLVLASTLALKPTLLLLDEPTNELDPLASQTFLHALFRINKELGITIIVATHSPEQMLPYADRQLCLENRGLSDVPLAQQTIAPEAFFCTPAQLDGCRTENAQPKKKLASLHQNNAEATTPSHTLTKKEPAQKEPEQKASDQEKLARKKPTQEKGRHKNRAPKKHLQNAFAQNNPALSCKEVFFRYDKKEPLVLKGASFEVQKQSVHALVGSNACGKSTLLALTARTLKPERGKVTNTLYSSQGFIPQDPKALFVCDSVMEELQEWQRENTYTTEEIDHILDEFNLKSHKLHHPYDLSRGQQQLLAFAKIALTKPELFILDEPTKGLDPTAKFIFAKKLRAFIEDGATALIATHDLEFAACVADTITLLFDGEEACSETASEFFQNNLFYRAHRNAFTDLWTQKDEQ